MKENILVHFLLLILFVICVSLSPAVHSHVVKSKEATATDVENGEVPTTANYLSDDESASTATGAPQTPVTSFPLFGDRSHPFLPSQSIANVQPVSDAAKTDGDEGRIPIRPEFNVTLLSGEILIGLLPSTGPQTKLACSCGLPEQHKICEDLMAHDDDCKIVGGQTAFIRDFPWTVALVRRGTAGIQGRDRPFCGGTLINNRYVLTASHCVDGQSARDIQVLVNEQDIGTTSEVKTIKLDAQQIIMHHAYSRATIDNDIALILLDRAVDINSPVSFTRPACISGSSHDFAGSIATVVGWGAKSQGGATSDTLQKVDIPVISNQDCRDKTTYGDKITGNMLCAGNVNDGGKDSCQGDSGGPLIASHGGRKTLIGIVSWGHGCAQPRSPGVYTRVTRYADWILQNTRQGDWCDG